MIGECYQCQYSSCYTIALQNVTIGRHWAKCTRDLQVNKNSVKETKCKSSHCATTECPFVLEELQMPWNLASTIKGLINMFCHIHWVPVCEQVITCTNDLHELSLYFKAGIIHAYSQGSVGLIAICSFTLDKIASLQSLGAGEQRYRVAEYLWGVLLQMYLPTE